MTQYIILAAIAGFFIPLQALINARLGAYLTGPLSAAFTNFSVGLIVLFVYFMVTRAPVPAFAQIGAVPWWGWLGGALGAFFVASAAISVAKLGTASMISVVIAAQLFAAMLFDHYGVLHAAQPLNLMRGVGAVFLLVGVYLILQPEA